MLICKILKILKYYINYKMSGFSLGFNQKRYSNVPVNYNTLYIGSTRGKGSITRVNYNSKFGTNKDFTYAFMSPPTSNGDLLYSKNNTITGGFTVGEPIEKDMIYTYRSSQKIFSSNNDQTKLFEDMTDFVDKNIVIGDKNIVIEDDLDKYNSSYWSSWGSDIFDEFGFFYLYDVEFGQYYFPLLNPINTNNGTINTQTFNAFNRTFTINHGYPVEGIFKFDISVTDNKPFKFGMYGHLGSDVRTTYNDLSYPYTINNTNLTLYYLYNFDPNPSMTNQTNNKEHLYIYTIPKLVSQNNGKTYNKTYVNNDLLNIVSTTVTNGLIVYLSKTNDTREWVTNDLAINH